MSTELREQIYESLNLRETEDLLEIWEINDRVEWSDDAFEVIREILTTRAVEIPPQGEPVYEKGEREDETHDRDGLEEWEAKLLDQEEQSEFYDTLEVLDLRKKLDKASQAAIIVYGALIILNLPGMLNFLVGKIPSWQELINSILPSFFSSALYATQAVVIVFVLREG